MNNLKYNLSTLQLKAKERTVKTQSIEYDLETLVKKIERGIIKLDPDYQRRHRWDEKTSSRLIESLILNIPIPIVYISQDIDVDAEINSEEARYSVIDGQQRLTAMFNFHKNNFALTGLDSLSELNDCYFNDLPPFLIRRLEERTVKCLRIDSTLDDQVKIDIFERLNSGSVKLEAQELRNAVLSGKFNDLCKELSANNNYRILIQLIKDTPTKRNRVQKMVDVELVLRFFSLINENYLIYKRPKGSTFGDFLSMMMKLYNEYNDDTLKKLSNEFAVTMSTILRDFGPMAFAKFNYKRGRTKNTSKFNASVFDALAVACHDLIFNEGIKSFTGKADAFHHLFYDDDFFQSLTVGYLDNAKINYRIERVKSILR